MSQIGQCQGRKDLHIQSLQLNAKLGVTFSKFADGNKV